MKFLAFVPARLESRRFPNKILKKIFGIPMITHVIKRAKYTNIFDEIIVITNNKKNKKILTHITSNIASKILISKHRHPNGTSRVSEVSKKFQYDIGAILFADEPFLKPSKLDLIINKTKKIKNFDVLNVITNLNFKDMKSKHVVKCIIDKNGLIKDYFRVKKKIEPRTKIYKSSGILIFKKKILDNFKKLKISKKENQTKIEQFRFLDNNLRTKSIFVKDIYPSINTPNELNYLMKLIKSKSSELSLIKKIKNL